MSLTGKLSLLIILSPLLFISCVTTRTYEKSSQQFYQGDLLMGEESSYTTSKGENPPPEKKKLKEKSGKYVSSFDMDSVHVEAETVITNKSKKEEVNVKIYKDNEYISERDYVVKNGKIKKDSSKKKSSATKKIENYMEEKFEIPSLDNCFSNAMDVVLNPNTNVKYTTNENTKNIVNYEMAVVRSKPNGKYIAYTFLGKPFVILGSTIFNLCRSVGYSVINFLGGYASVADSKFLWIMPDVKGAKAKATQAKVENQIVYPEYHIPLTDNHIVIDKVTGETESRVSEIDPDEIHITTSEVHEYDNSLSVKKSVEKDVNRTTSIVGLIGTIITVPISAVSWVFGAVFGIATE